MFLFLIKSLDKILYLFYKKRGDVRIK